MSDLDQQQYPQTKDSQGRGGSFFFGKSAPSLLLSLYNPFVIPLFLPKGRSSPHGTLVGRATLPDYKYSKNGFRESPGAQLQGNLYQMSTDDWRRYDEEIGGERIGVLLLFWGEIAPAEIYL